MIIRHDFGQSNVRRSENARQRHHANAATLLIGFDKMAHGFWSSMVGADAAILSASRFFEMSTAEFREHAPILVMSPLVMADIDAMDDACHLTQLGFRGSYRAVVNRLPSARMVEREIAAVSPLLDVRVLELARTLPAAIAKATA